MTPDPTAQAAGAATDGRLTTDDLEGMLPDEIVAAFRALTVECDGRGRELEAARECHVEQRRRADDLHSRLLAAEAEGQALRDALVIKGEVCNPEIGCDHPEDCPQGFVCLDCGDGWCEGETARHTSSCVLSRPPSELGAAILAELERFADLGQLVLDRITNGATPDERYLMKDTARIAMDAYRALVTRGAQGEGEAS